MKYLKHVGYFITGLVVVVSALVMMAIVAAFLKRFWFENLVGLLAIFCGREIYKIGRFIITHDRE